MILAGVVTVTLPPLLTARMPARAKDTGVPAVPALPASTWMEPAPVTTVTFPEPSAARVAKSGSVSGLFVASTTEARMPTARLPTTVRLRPSSTVPPTVAAVSTTTLLAPTTLLPLVLTA